MSIYNKFVSGVKDAGRQEALAFYNIGKFSIAPIAFSINLIATPEDREGFIDLSSLSRLIGVLYLPWTAALTVVTLPLGIIASIATAVGSIPYAIGKGIAAVITTPKIDTSNNTKHEEKTKACDSPTLETPASILTFKPITPLRTAQQTNQTDITPPIAISISIGETKQSALATPT